MHAFGLSKELCDEFLRKQCVISNISEGKMKGHMTYENLSMKLIFFLHFFRATKNAVRQHQSNV